MIEMLLSSMVFSKNDQEELIGEWLQFHTQDGITEGRVTSVRTDSKGTWVTLNTAPGL